MSNGEALSDQALAVLQKADTDRALLYLAIFRESKKRLGEAEAIDLLRTALNQHGRAFGETLSSYAPRDFRGLYNAFAVPPDGSAKAFSPREDRCDEECLEIKFMTCPLKKAWQNAGVEDEELCTLLHCASALDEGAMDAAGFSLDIQPWKPGEEGCCRLRISEK